MSARDFESVVLPHLDAAFNYARWLTGNDPDAEDVVQDACIRAMRYLPSLRNPSGRAWFFAIVRNTWYTRVSQRPVTVECSSDEPLDRDVADDALDPEARLLQDHTVAQVRVALEALPAHFRETIVLRELEGLSYKEIAAVTRVPIGTVMSRLARARERLFAALEPARMEVLP